MLKAVIYARYSSDMQREESIEAQLLDIRKYADRNGIIIIKEYKDEAVSGQTEMRTAFQAMMTEAKRRTFDLIIVHKVDRFTRNRYDAAVYKSMLAKYGVRVVYAMQPIDDSPEGGLLEGILESFAEYYSKNLATEVMKGLKQNAYKAQFNGGYVPLGYNVVDKQYVINEKEAFVVKEIFHMYLKGYGYKKISDMLNEKGCKNKKNNPFVYNSIACILTNEKYAGDYAFNKTRRTYNDGKRNLKLHKKADEVIRITDALPAIISKEVFEMTQKEIKRRAVFRGVTLTKREYLLSGLVSCACGRRMVGYSSARTKGAPKHFYYRCPRCGCSIKAEIIETKVLDIIQEQVFNSIDNLIELILEYAAKKNSEKSDELKYLNNELKTVGQQLNNIVDMIANGVASTQLGKKLQELETYQEGIKLRIAELAQNNEVSKAKLETWLLDLKAKFDEQEDLKNLVKLFIKQIRMSRDDIEIDFFVRAPYKGASSSSAAPSAPVIPRKTSIVKK